MPHGKGTGPRCKGTRLGDRTGAADELRSQTDPWSRAAQALGVELSYLERMARRELGKPLGPLNGCTAAQVGDVILELLCSASPWPQVIRNRALEAVARNQVGHIATPISDRLP
jgi:hypothetical protein